MTAIMQEGRKKTHFMSYFPSVFYKKLPPRKYFWHVYSTIENAAFKQTYDQEFSRIKLKIKKSEGMILTPTHKAILSKRRAENLELLLSLKKRGVKNNLTHLSKKVKKPTGQQRIENYMEPHEQNLQETEF